MYEELIQALQLHCEAGKKIGLSGAIWTLLDDASTALKSMTAQLAALQSENAEKDKRIARVEAERDAAVDLLRRLPESCCSCKYSVDGEACPCSECDDADTENCTEACPWWGDPCGLCNDKDSWTFCSAQREG